MTWNPCKSGKVSLGVDQVYIEQSIPEIRRLCFEKCLYPTLRKYLPGRGQWRAALVKKIWLFANFEASANVLSIEGEGGFLTTTGFLVKFWESTSPARRNPAMDFHCIEMLLALPAFQVIG